MPPKKKNHKIDVSSGALQAWNDDHTVRPTPPRR